MQLDEIGGKKEGGCGFVSCKTPHAMYSIHIYHRQLQSHHEKVKTLSEPSFPIICKSYKLLIVSFHIAFRKKEKENAERKYIRPI